MAKNYVPNVYMMSMALLPFCHHRQMTSVRKEDATFVNLIAFQDFGVFYVRMQQP